MNWPAAKSSAAATYVAGFFCALSHIALRAAAARAKTTASDSFVTLLI
jgi:hypothetical protein